MLEHRLKLRRKIKYAKLSQKFTADLAPISDQVYIETLAVRLIEDARQVLSDTYANEGGLRACKLTAEMLIEQANAWSEEYQFSYYYHRVYDEYTLGLTVAVEGYHKSTLVKLTVILI